MDYKDKIKSYKKQEDMKGNLMTLKQNPLSDLDDTKKER